MEIPQPTFRCRRGNNSTSMYCFKPRGISLLVMCFKYSAAALGRSSFFVNWTSFPRFMAHLFEHTYARSSEVIAGSLSKVWTLPWQPRIDPGSTWLSTHCLVQEQRLRLPHIIVNLLLSAACSDVFMVFLLPLSISCKCDWIARACQDWSLCQPPMNRVLLDLMRAWTSEYARLRETSFSARLRIRFSQ